jgi:hypothetical protein
MYRPSFCNRWKCQGYKLLIKLIFDESQFVYRDYSYRDYNLPTICHYTTHALSGYYMEDRHYYIKNL